MKKQKNNISFIDKITLCYYTCVKNFYYQFDKNLSKYYSYKISKYFDLKDKQHIKITTNYNKAKGKYDKYIAYLQYKQLHKK